MRNYILKRLLRLIPSILLLTFLTFGLMYLAPGDPAENRLKAGGIAPTEEMLQAAREEMGLDKPFLERYGIWLWNVMHGDLGNSYKDDQPVADKLVRATKNTLILAGSALLLALVISIPLGIFSAVLHNKLPDYLIRFFAFLGNALPRFLVAILLIYYFCVHMQLLPVIAKNTFQGLILPTCSMAFGMSSEFVRQVRSEALEQLGQNYVIGARSRGVKESYILFKNVLRNASITLLTILGLSIAGLMCGSVVIETIFMWPGLGKLVMDAINARDYPVVQGFVIWITMIYFICNLLTDISYRLVDPRILED